MKQEFKPFFSWEVTYFDCNAQKITNYNILEYRIDFIKKLKKKCATKEEFTEALKRECMYQFWSKSQWELVIKLTEDGRVILSPWCGCRNPNETEIDVTDDDTFDWQGFAIEHIGKQIFKNAAKIDVYDQLTYKDQFEKLVDYCWYKRLKYERDNIKFHEE